MCTQVLGIILESPRGYFGGHPGVNKNKKRKQIYMMSMCAIILAIRMSVVILMAGMMRCLGLGPDLITAISILLCSW